MAESRFDFLKDLVMAVPDVQGEGEEGGSGTVSVPGTPTGLVHHQQHPPVFIRSQSEASTLIGTTAGSSSSTAPRRVVGGTGRPRGRPRKNPVVTFQNPAATRLIAKDSFYKVYFYVSKSIYCFIAGVVLRQAENLELQIAKMKKIQTNRTMRMMKRTAQTKILQGKAPS